MTSTRGYPPLALALALALAEPTRLGAGGC